MGLFSRQFANVVEWEEFRDDMIFWKWNNTEIKKGSRLILRPGQDAIFLYNGQIEGIFTEDGEFDMESEIIPFLSTLKGFKFGFNSGMRAEVLFVNTKEFVVKWGTSNAINIPAPGLPGGMPIRSFGTYTFRVSDCVRLIDKIAGIRDSYLVENVQIRISAVLDQLLMKWISKEGRDMFNLQANSFDIANGIRSDLDAQIAEDGLTIGDFNIMSFTYPKEIQDMINKTASHSMIGDLGRYQQVSMTDAMAQGHNAGGSTAADMAGMMMGMNLANQMMQNMQNSQNAQMSNTQSAQTPNSQSVANPQSTPGAPASGSGTRPNFCPDCGTKTEGANFCPNCGRKLF